MNTVTDARFDATILAVKQGLRLPDVFLAQTGGGCFAIRVDVDGSDTGRHILLTDDVGPLTGATPDATTTWWFSFHDANNCETGFWQAGPIDDAIAMMRLAIQGAL